MTTASASSSERIVESPLATRVTDASKPPPRSSSRTSRPSRVSLPTMAMVLSANLLLRGFRGPDVGAAAHQAADDTGDAQADSGGYVRRGERQQERLPEIPGEVDTHSDRDQCDRR